MFLKIFVSWLRWKAQRAPRSTLIPESIRRIVVIELTRLGDLTAVLPCIDRLRRQFPSAEVSVVVDAGHAPLLALCEGPLSVMGVRRSTSPARFLRTLRAVRRAAPDLVCSMSPSNRNAALALASGARYTVGYLNGTDSLTPFLGIAPVESIGLSGTREEVFARENIEDRPWKVLQALGIPAPNDGGRTIRAWKPEAGLLARMRARIALKDEPYIVIHPFSGWEFRSWPLEGFITLTADILRNLAHAVVFICHESEQGRLDDLVHAFPQEPRVQTFSSSDILETAALLRGADLFVGNDSGPLHLAALLGVPVVGLYGPAAPVFTAPLSARGTFLYRPVHCSPCGQTRCVMPDDSCMRRIPAGDVFAAVTRELVRTGRTAMHG